MVDVTKRMEGEGINIRIESDGTIRTGCEGTARANDFLFSLENR